MVITVLDAAALREIFLSGAVNLENNKEWINDLNVFPVPDGDTGTNMTLTIRSAVREIEGLEELNMETLSKAISSGSLRGARGNSGVILSQLFRGFTKEMKSHAVLDEPAIAAAMKKATETAYKAVMKPKEGTILTVARGMSEEAEKLLDKGLSLEEFFARVIEKGDEVLDYTPELLPVLKEAGVVDSGGQGLMQFLKGAFSCLKGQPVEPAEEADKPARESADIADSQDLGEITFGYCTEFLVNLEKPFGEKEELDFKAYLEGLGDCVVVADDEVVKVHVHTNDPGLAIQKGLSYGSLSRMKIDNMREEHEEKLIKEASRIAAQEKQKKPAEPVKRKPSGFIVVSSGEGLAEIFRSLDVDEVIEGGQTMNPSTDDFVKAAGRIPADTVYILPNNKNIILAAEQASYLVEDKKLVVIPTTTVPQGITAVIAFSPEADPEENRAVMTEEIERVQTCQITYAVRDTVLEGREIHQNDYMGIGDHSALHAVGSDINEVAMEAIRKMADDDSELISIYYGSDVEEAQAQTLFEAVNEEFGSIDIELHDGGQPIYYYIISVE